MMRFWVGAAPSAFRPAATYSAIWRAAPSVIPVSRFTQSTSMHSSRMLAISADSSAVRAADSPVQNGIVGGCPLASATRTIPGSTLRMRHDVLPSWKMSPWFDSMAKSSFTLPTGVPSGSITTW